MDRIKVSKVAKQIRGVSYKPEDLHDMRDDNSVTLLRANNIQDGKVDFEDVLYVDKSKVSQVQYLQKGDILVCASSGSKSIVGKAASIDFDGEYTFGAFCKVVRPIPDMIDYLGVYFQSQIYRDIISKAAMGANINNIRNEHIDNLEIPEKTSKEISSIIQRIKLLQYIIDRRNLELQKLDELVKARFVEMFGNPLDGTAKYLIHQVGKVAEAVDPQPSHRTPPIEEGGIPYVSIKDCDYKTGKIDFQGARRVSTKVLEEHLQRYTLKDGDFIIGKIGTIGQPIFVPARRDYALSANIVLIQPDSELVSPYFLKYSFESDFVERQFAEAKNSTSQAAFGIQKVRTIEVMDPDLDVQWTFERFTKQIDKLKLSIRKSLEQMEILKKALMQKYFG